MELEGITIDIPSETPAQAAQGEVETVETIEPVVDWQKKAQTLQEIANRKDKQIARERAEKEELRRYKEMYELHTNAPKAPKEESYSDVADLIAAKLEYNQQHKAYEDKLKALEQPKQEQGQPKQYSQDFLQAVQVTSQKIDKAKAANPEFRAIVDQHAQMLDQAPDHVYEAFSALENPEAALYEVLKSGELENIYYLSPAQAAIRIAMAEQRGKVAMRPPVTKAQPPISPNKGTSSVRSVESLHGESLIKWMTS